MQCDYDVSVSQVPIDGASVKTDTSLCLHVLASGSRGNAALVVNKETEQTLLIDCGICKRDFFTLCHEVGVDPASIVSILITHEHTDHTKGLGVVMRGLAAQGLYPSLYVSDAVREASKEIRALQNFCDMRSLQEEYPISSAGMTVYPFATSHDAAESFGFRFENKAKQALGFMADTGKVTPQAYEALQKCCILALESNHDTRMLETGPYPYVLKKRVGSDKGHLSNTQAGALLEGLLNNELTQVCALHISENNNTYRLPKEILTDVLDRNGHSAQAVVAYQHRVVSVQGSHHTQE